MLLKRTLVTCFIQLHFIALYLCFEHLATYCFVKHLVLDLAPILREDVHIQKSLSHCREFQATAERQHATQIRSSVNQLGRCLCQWEKKKRFWQTDVETEFKEMTTLESQSKYNHHKVNMKTALNYNQAVDLHAIDNALMWILSPQWAPMHVNCFCPALR